MNEIGELGVDFSESAYNFNLTTEKSIRAIELYLLPGDGSYNQKKLDWEYNEWRDNKTLVIDILFEQPEMISLDRPRDHVAIVFVDGEHFISMISGKTLRDEQFIVREIPPQLEGSALAEFTKENLESFGSALTGTVVLDIGISVIFGLTL